jgi:hypothetical protein
MTMADPRLAAWIRQARSDLDAATSPAGAECHRRYWLQQACEKGIKALGLVLWRGHPADEGAFRARFLHHHSPLKRLREEIEADPAPPRALRALLRQLETELAPLDGDGLLRQVDATTPTADPADVSYRYPFRDALGHDVAPRDWEAADWDAYQGNGMGVSAAIRRFLDAVDARCKRSRGPA